MKNNFDRGFRFFRSGNPFVKLCLILLLLTANGFAQSKLQLSTKLSGSIDDKTGGERVRWRFRMDGLYSFVRPAIAPDGTVYAVDVSGTLYALSPAGALLWRFNGAGGKGVAVGADGTVYAASENAIKAINPNGTLKWNFELMPRAFVTLGVAVGPDGNIYSVAYESLGVFSLTPQGTLRWATPERYSRPIVEYGEIVFGANGKQQQLYFYANGRIRAVRLADGATVFPLSEIVQPFGQPAVSPLDDTVHANVLSYTPNGDLRWLLFNIYPSSIGFPAADVGIDGVHYVVYPGRRLYAINPDGSVKYLRDFAETFGNPIVSPNNTTLVIATVGESNGSSIVGFKAADGTENWRVPLPLENGLAQSVTTRARLTPDSRTAYLHTATSNGQTGESFLYAIDAAPNGGNLAPHAVAAADRTAGRAPITINFNSDGSFDTDGSIVSYLWDFGDGAVSTAANPAHVYNSAGRYTAKLTVTDNAGATGETFLPLELTSGGCLVNCARVTEMRLMANRKPGSMTITGTVRVQNENGTPLAGAGVRLLWTIPNRPALPVSVTTGSDGYAQVSLSVSKGTYTLNLSLIELAAYTFDEGNSIRTVTITR